MNLPDVQFPKLETHLESDPLFVLLAHKTAPIGLFALLAHKTVPIGLFALQFLEFKPLGHAVYLFFSIKISERNSLVSPSQLGLEPSAGLKPAPFLLEARHSVHLSYEGILEHLEGLEPPFSTFDASRRSFGL